LDHYSTPTQLSQTLEKLQGDPPLAVDVQLQVLTILALATRPIGDTIVPIQRELLKALLGLIRQEEDQNQDLDEILKHLTELKLIEHNGNDEWGSLVVKEEILSYHRNKHPCKDSNTTVYRRLLRMTHLHVNAFDYLAGMCKEIANDASKGESPAVVDTVMYDCND